VDRVAGGDDAAEAPAAVDAQVEDAAFPTAVNDQITDAVAADAEAPVADEPGAEASTTDAPLAATAGADDAAAPAEGEEPAQG
jgi:hypothetical protein